MRNRLTPVEQFGRALTKSAACRIGQFIHRRAMLFDCDCARSFLFGYRSPRFHRMIYCIQGAESQLFAAG
jgi:hypothetical protein